MSEVDVVILAAGKGSRMKDDLSKPLHKVAGLPMLEWICRAVRKFNPKNIIAVQGADEDFSSYVDETVVQKEQLGSADALRCAFPKIDAEKLIVINADMPLMTENALVDLVEKGEGFDAALLTADLKKPFGYGRVIPVGERNVVEQIVEERDATADQKKLHLVNTGVYLFRTDYIKRAINNVTTDNSQSEYYLTDALPGAKIVQVADWQDILGVNTQQQLAAVSKIARKRINDQIMANGVTMIDPLTTYIDANVLVGTGTIIKPGTVIEHDSVIGAENEIGPYAHLREKTVTGIDVHIGNFVETKNAKIGDHTHIGHLTYVGDAEVGQAVNIGAGTIFVNYDGKNKHMTKVGDRAFIGSNSKLVAPVEIASEAITAAGSTITDNVDRHAMGIARQRQTNKSDFWQRMPHEDFATEYDAKHDQRDGQP
ncbi:glucosamine-1-phosphate N-acetyltransferase [Oenococcus oeni]|uniref:bifunctional UDP-N-acetylglucosamine diphosphorylase/glucosamine-1-phosphate N-acetyltransferase GlmU n=1 Tax=Oenococcus oeni TaxID=1247 RepID=UPI000BDED75B|nr:NTP transferase domain-containing protein [Oenococcus oeni]PDH86379.1 glucosamine-1-phosphate N-acetyltransferase [Oenococcus oeni]PDH89690.1 glucosamine-1-phosphate N-acetyltransferase [Oenococcus oeni]PDH90804.1 glucosamine-1-phosphate N-acetyltransferase [Oenococcus oeni]PDH91328.1 glucosamine-1-phosphate N-acetyltransferase [Oenococcus oeni]RJF39714.1 glucosamine-1-phosphate N-acetyltransferase [Oenococcus oeni]